jgi:selenocysteine-specific elongation factor
LIAADVVEQARRVTLESTTAYHRTHPLEPGIPRELARRAVQDHELADHVHRLLEQEGAVVIEGQTLRSADHRAALDASQAEVGRGLLDALRKSGKLGQTASELSALVGGDEGVRLAEFYVREGTAVRVGRDRYYDKECLDGVLHEILGAVRRHGGATPAQLREETGLSRKYLIPLLEWMDGRRLTVRDGDARRLGPEAGAVDSR